MRWGKLRSEQALQRTRAVARNRLRSQLKPPYLCPKCNREKLSAKREYMEFLFRCENCGFSQLIPAKRSWGAIDAYNGLIDYLNGE